MPIYRTPLRSNQRVSTWKTLKKPSYLIEIPKLSTRRYGNLDNTLSWAKLMESQDQRKTRQYILDGFTEVNEFRYPEIRDLFKNKLKTNLRDRIRYVPSVFKKDPQNLGWVGGWADNKRDLPFMELNKTAFENKYKLVFTVGHEMGHFIERCHPKIFRGVCWHQIQPGENLTLITRQYQDHDNWRDLYNLNHRSIGGNPNHIIAGRWIKLPNSWNAWQRGATDDGRLFRELDATIRDANGTHRPVDFKLKRSTITTLIKKGDNLLTLLKENRQPHYTAHFHNLMRNPETSFIPGSIENHWQQAKRSLWQNYFQTPGMLDLPQYKRYTDPLFPRRQGTLRQYWT